MPQQERATTTTISSISEAHLGRKLRVAGRLLSYDLPTCLGRVCSKEAAVLVDLSLCAGPWIRDALQGCVMVTGYLEALEKGATVPTVAGRFAAPHPDPRIVLRALLARATPDLDIGLWDKAVGAAHETSEEQFPS
ncbi:hypothetical protein BD626DRAFT_22128 [Schizophyllum amplum]|uniref:CST complex subunit Ten1 n=1 Tax=Schizophyllum amplum TaxID=97359 RepID=A0A550CZ13_9AGAR|nr:hypothetical protein BD626DRAFT_22128 [Auriculariopsis ampla]